MVKQAIHDGWIRVQFLIALKILFKYNLRAEMVARINLRFIVLKGVRVQVPAQVLFRGERR